MNHSYKKQTLSLMGLGSGMTRVLKRRKKKKQWCGWHRKNQKNI
jgi:hypothetical protein